MLRCRLYILYIRGSFSYIIVTYPDLDLEAGRLTTWRLTLPALILLKTEMDSL